MFPARGPLCGGFMTAGQGENQGGEGLCWQREAGASRDVVAGDVPSTLQELWVETAGATHTRDW